MRMEKKAEMGIGTLIIFISLLLVAAIAAGVLIQTTGSLQEKALTTGDQAKAQIATNVEVIEVSATDGRNSYVTDFQEIIKLAPGSDEIKLSQALITMNTYDYTLTLTYAGTSAGTTNDINGYYTWNVETVSVDAAPGNDYDKDGTSENVTLGQGGAKVYLNLSSKPALELGNCNASGVFNKSLTNLTLVKDVSGTCSGNNVVTVTLTPVNVSKGVFSVQYLQKGSNWVAGNLQRGDVIRVYLEAPANINEAEEVRLNFIPKIGTPTLTEFVTPEVISTERVYLYP